MIEIIALILKNGLLGKNDEPMSKPTGDKKLQSVFASEFHRHTLAIGR